MMVSVLKAKLDQEKGKTASDDFFVALTRQLDNGLVLQSVPRMGLFKKVAA
ncbi:hypothetical protein YC2023_048398 [Brassica napus]